jgi:hypothetical protein
MAEVRALALESMVEMSPRIAEASRRPMASAETAETKKKLFLAATIWKISWTDKKRWEII